MGKDLKGKELGKNLLQRKDGRYEAKYTDNYGKRHSIYGEKLSDVRKKLNEALYNVEHNIYEPNCQFTLNEWFEIWVDTYRKNVIRVTTLARLYRYYDKNVRDELGYVKISQLKPIILQRFYNKLVEQGVSKNSVIHVQSIIRGMCEQAMVNGYIMFNPCSGVKINFQNVQEKERRVLTIQEQDLFFKYAKEYKYYDIFRLLLLTGLRVGEITALTWDDINFKNKTLSVNKTFVCLHNSDVTIINKYIKSDIEIEDYKRIHDPKTKSSNRVIPLSNQALSILQEIYGKRNPDVNYIFYTKSGLQITRSNIRTALDRIVARINKYEDETFQQVSPHVFRHTFATRCFENGIPPKVVQHLLGHINLSTTMDLYTHVTDEMERSEIMKIDDIINF